MYPNIDYLHGIESRTRVYIGGSLQNAQKVEIPQGANMAYFMLYGAGGGGAGGLTAATSTSTAGGAGGGSGALCAALIPVALLPQSIYFCGGAPGIGGASAGNGTAGSATYLTTVMTNTTPAGRDVILTANGGGGGTGSTAGTAGAIHTNTNATFCNMRVQGFNSTINGIAGQAGGAGSAGAAGGLVSIDQAVTIPLHVRGGAAGGGVSAANALAAGGTMTGTSGSIHGPFGSSATTTAGQAGSGGLRLSTLPYPFFNTGGSGGHGNTGTSQVGGAGGNGGLGSGGGGGGCSTGTTPVGGRGGDGGAGFLIAIFF